jgi:3-hydroxy acid dehydrogenase/malonic semialdehyde reductase
LQDKLAELAKKLATSYKTQKITYKAFDVGDYEAVDSAVASAIKEVGPIDILVNNARPSQPTLKPY